MRTALPLLLAACATTTTTTPKSGPRGLHADEHLDMARHHDEAARQATRVPDRYAAQEAVGVPWTRSWNAATEHERLAAVHRSNAAQLHAAYEEACGPRSASEIPVSPLVRYGLATWNTSAGVILYLSPDAGPPDKLIADMKCHRAWMMLAHDETMEDCPLDLPGIHVDARGEENAITVSIVIDAPNLVEELQRRAAHDLEMGAQLRNPPK